VTRELVILGSTGSVGTQALDVVARAEPGRFRVVGIAAGGSDPKLLAQQAMTHRVEVVAVARATAAQDLQLAFYAEAQARGYAAGAWNPPRVLAGPDAVAELATRRCDLVVNAVDGAAGLTATLAALTAGSTVGLANKESLTVGGPLVMDILARQGVIDPLTRLLPIDSEHSAILQCLAGLAPGQVAGLVVTASGGPFRGRARGELADVTLDQALAHPTWTMGQLITLNSATLMNKGLEVIEAQLLFGHLLPGSPYDAIDVVVHPQSLVHSMVTCVDGSTLAQLSPPDMRLPISLALDAPHRVPDAATPMDWSRPATMTFEPLDAAAFPAVDLCRAAGRTGGTATAVLTAANEEAVAAFVAGHLRFPAIVDTVGAVLAEHVSVVAPTLEDVTAAALWARRRARELTEKELAG